MDGCSSIMMIIRAVETANPLLLSVGVVLNRCEVIAACRAFRLSCDVYIAQCVYGDILRDVFPMIRMVVSHRPNLIARRRVIFYCGVIVFPVPGVTGDMDVPVWSKRNRPGAVRVDIISSAVITSTPGNGAGRIVFYRCIIVVIEKFDGFARDIGVAVCVHHNVHAPVIIKYSRTVVIVAPYLIAVGIVFDGHKIRADKISFRIAGDVNTALIIHIQGLADVFIIVRTVEALHPLGYDDCDKWIYVHGINGLGVVDDKAQNRSVFRRLDLQE